MRRRTILTGAALSAAGLSRPGFARVPANILRFVPYVNLTSLDPVWTVTGATLAYGYMVYDMLYGIDDTFEPRPQMCAGHEISDNGLTWTFTLRDGLLFHDNEKVRASDCVPSIARWASRDPFGQQLAAATGEMRVLDDKRFQIRLKKPFPQMLAALGGRACFMMPERVAKLPPTEQLKEPIGSGPFRFLPKEWVSGASAAWEKFDKYAPRQEKPSNLSGGKVVNFERIEWVVQPDQATGAAALRTGEVDWLEMPLIDLLPAFKAAGGITTEVVNRWGQMCVLVFNHLYPPFDNPKLRRALLPAIDQKAFMEACVGDQSRFARHPEGYFAHDTPMATHAGLEVLTGPRDMALAKRLIAEAGYKNERIVMLSPTDFPLQGQLGQMARGLLTELGFNIDFIEMDFGSQVVRRQNTSPPDKGGWNIIPQTWSVLNSSNPGNSQALRATGKTGGFGWATDETLEKLRQQWYDAPDHAAQLVAAEKVQRRGLEVLPQVPLGRVYLPAAFRDNVKDIVKAPYPIFWGVRKV